MVQKAKTGINDFVTWCNQNGHRDLLAEWDYKKNTDISPYKITSGSNKSAFWICSKGHNWRAVVAHRSKGIGCPYCSGRNAIKGENDLATVNPELAKEWNYDKNGVLTPESVKPGTNKVVWWKCPKGHEWRSSVINRTKGNGCPCCNKEHKSSFPEQAILFYIRKVFPDAECGNKSAVGMEVDIYIPSVNIAVEYDGVAWHNHKRDYDLRKNRLCKDKCVKLIRVREPGLDEYDDCICIIRDDVWTDDSLTKAITELMVNISSTSYVEIDVNRDRQLIYNTYIINEKENSLLKKYPHIAKEWDYDKNGQITPDMVAGVSGKKFWWKCDRGHEWQSYVNVRIRGIGCPYCSGRIAIKGENDLVTLNPKLSAEWNYDKNGDNTPDQYKPSSHNKVWWICSLGHEWESIIANRNKGSGCPYCANNKVLKGFNDLATMNPKLANEWNYERNGELTPETVTKSSSRKVWWKCSNGHEWETTVNSRAGGNSCPFCSGQRVLSGYNDLLTINPKLAKEWNYEKNTKLTSKRGIDISTPDRISAGSNVKVWWKCNMGHEWQAAVVDRNNGTQCPFCRGMYKNT